jgi:hypothetical protein
VHGWWVGACWGGAEGEVGPAGFGMGPEAEVVCAWEDLGLSGCLGEARAEEVGERHGLLGGLYGYSVEGVIGMGVLGIVD